MPWTPAQAKQKHEGLTDAQAKVWAKIANSTLKRELAKGTSQKEAEAIAIRTAHVAIDRQSEQLIRQRTGTMTTLLETSAKNELLTEFMDCRGVQLKVDRERGIIQGVKLLGLESRNGRVYPKETIARAVQLYESAKVNVDHPQQNPTAPRSYFDRMGRIVNITLDSGNGGLRGDFHFNPKHHLAEQLMWDAEHAPENVGFSHNVQARVGRRNGKVIVEEINKVVSVDLVADPATTHGLFEDNSGRNREEDLDMAELTLEGLQADRPDLVETIRTAALAERDESGEIEKLQAENAKQASEFQGLKEQFKAMTDSLAEREKELDQYKAAEAMAKKKAEVEARIAEAKLPDALVTDVFRQSLLNADEEGRKALIQERLELAKIKDVSSLPKSKEQHQVDRQGAELLTNEQYLGTITH